MIIYSRACSCTYALLNEQGILPYHPWGSWGVFAFLGALNGYGYMFEPDTIPKSMYNGVKRWSAMKDHEIFYLNVARARKRAINKGVI